MAMVNLMIINYGAIKRFNNLIASGKIPMAKNQRLKLKKHRLLQDYILHVYKIYYGFIHNTNKINVQLEFDKINDQLLTLERS